MLFVATLCTIHYKWMLRDPHTYLTIKGQSTLPIKNAYHNIVCSSTDLHNIIQVAISVPILTQDPFLLSTFATFATVEY